MRYQLVMNDNDLGCGHTIHCGTKVIEFDAPDDEAAQARVRQEVEDHGFDQISEVNLYRIPQESVVPFSLEAVQEEIAQAETAAKAAKQEAKEKAEYERLKRKFE